VQEPCLILAIDTCGPSGSVALGRLAGPDREILGQIELKGRTYSATLVSAVGDLLQAAGAEVRDLGGIVVVNGPGSFTGVRVGVSAVKGLAEGAGIPVIAVSRLEVLAKKSGIKSAALDAHRGEVFLRLERPGSGPEELLAGAPELAAVIPKPDRAAVCDEAAEVLAAAWPEVQHARTSAPLASDALALAGSRLLVGERVDLAQLDGHYLRRSDAEIFGKDVIAQQAAAELKGV
jgi:tRNA threonylcarbamoyladenosine biosynthesis protein TsaB